MPTLTALMEQAARSIPQPLRAATYQTLIGLLAATGMRVGEAIRLDRGDIDSTEGVLRIRRSKFGKSRHGAACRPARVDALERYAAPAPSALPGAAPATSFFVSLRGTRVIYACVWPTHRALCQQRRRRRRSDAPAQDP